MRDPRVVAAANAIAAPESPQEKTGTIVPSAADYHDGIAADEVAPS